MNRREFLQAGTAGMTLSAIGSYPAVFASQNHKRVALIGCGWYGKSALFRLLQVEPVEVTAVCDVDKQMLAEAADMIAERQVSKKKPRTYSDYRNFVVIHFMSPFAFVGFV